SKELLRQCGVVDTSVRLERVIMEPDRSRVDEYEFWSPLAQGHYRVNHHGFIDLYLERPVELP
ncbi:MAG TPA: hypothetical protein VJ085_02580, partial [Candidatus Acidoferrales bacterium]|nr:hypothetical protein [Candidatus Acidoferrales bacterium]